MNPVKHILVVALDMLRAPAETLEGLKSGRVVHAIVFLLFVGGVTALLTPVQLYLGFDDVNGLHAGGQAEVLARDVSALYELGIIWRPLLIEAFYMVILLFTTAYLHVILKIVGGKGSINDTLKMIAYGDSPGLLFGWIPYFATISAVWAAVIQLLIGPVVFHKISWARASVIFSSLVGLGIIEIALSQR